MNVFRMRILLAILSLAIAPATANSCDPDPRIALAIHDAVGSTFDPLQPYPARIRPLFALAEQHPLDPFVQRALLRRFDSYMSLLQHEELLPRFEKLRKAHSDRVEAVVSYARSIRRRSTTGAIAALRPFAESSNPLVHLLLAQLEKNETARFHLDRYLSACPDTVDSEAFPLISRLGDTALWRSASRKARARIAGRDDPASLAAWTSIWELEFKMTPAQDHDSVRSRIREDLRAIESLKPARAVPYFRVLLDGYELLKDDKQLRRIQDRVLADLPATQLALSVHFARWQQEHPRPRRDASPEEWQHHFVASFEFGRTMWKAWPYSSDAINTILSALANLDEFPADWVREEGLGLIDATKDFLKLSDSSLQIELAQYFVRARVHLDRVPALIADGRREVEARLQANLAQERTPFPGGAPMVRRVAMLETWQARATEIQWQRVSGKRQQAEQGLGELLAEIGTAAELTLAHRLGAYQGVGQRCIENGDLAALRKVLGRMEADIAALRSAKLESSYDKLDAGARELGYWNLKAGLAEASGNAVDAVAFYRRASSVEPRDMLQREALASAAKARRAYLSAGGSEDGWKVLAGVEIQSGAYNPLAAWERKSRPLPDFRLEDLQGGQVTPRIFAGKRTFINIWATWCGPCQAELPFVQQLHDKLKGGADLQVLTLNMDENPGLVRPYMAERGYTFRVVLAEKFLDSMGVRGIPVNWIVDASGRVVLERSAGTGGDFVQSVLAALAASK